MINLPKIDLKKNESQAKLLIILCSAVALVLHFNFFLRPQIIRLTNVLNGMGKVSHDLKEAQSDIAKIDQFKKSIDANRAKVENYEKRLPAEQEIPKLLEDLSNMAKNSNVKILSITPIAANLREMGKARDEIYQEQPILISAKSGYHELGQFLSSLENADRFMKVVDIDVKSSRLTPKKHDVELAVSTFTLVNEKQ